jgi:hypothetical protein
MDPMALIETYVDDVAGRLPRRLRGDVAAELRDLLAEELAGKAAEAGRPADEAMALSLLRAFGAPAEVAERYRPAGFTIIRPSDAPMFSRIALGGVAVQWAISLPLHFARSASFGSGLGHIGGWWLSYGLGALWWPGFLVVCAIAAAWWRQRQPQRAWTPSVRVVDRDRVSRGWLGLGYALWLAGAAFWVAEPWLMQRAPAAMAAALRLDTTFLAERAVWLLPLWAVHFAIFGVVLWQGRWSPRLRLLSMVATLAICALLGWFILAGPVFVARPADDAVKLATALIVAVSLAAEAWRLLGRSGRVRGPSGLAASGT